MHRNLLIAVFFLAAAPAQAQTPEQEVREHAALIALYDATGGDSWNNNTNWKSDKPLTQWHGISTFNGIWKINLLNNNLTGSIPAEIGNLANLKSLSLHGYDNDFTGEIPSEIGNLVNLTHLDIYGGFNLTGSIPVEIGNLANLKSLNLSGNFRGSIPAELWNLTNLMHLRIRASSQYNGSNLTGGGIPVEIGNLTNLKSLNLSGNFRGSIPAELWNLTNLESLSLGANNFTGSIPPELGSLTNLKTLGLGANNFTGLIPPELGNLTEIVELNLGANNLTGSIPPELSNLTNLLSLRLNANNLMGSIPTEIGNLRYLRTLNLRNNPNLTGEIPAGLCRVPELLIINTSLTLNCDGVQIPDSLEHAALIALYDATDGDSWNNNTNWKSDKPLNEWHGVQGFDRISRIRLLGNNLTGSIPAELGNLAGLWELNLLGNNLTGSIPAELGNLADLWELDLSDNNLTGSIPAELCDIRNKYEETGRRGTVNVSGNSDLITKCFDIPHEYANNPQQTHWPTSEKDSLSFVLLRESEYGRLWMSVKNFEKYSMDVERLRRIEKVVFDSTIIDPNKGILQASVDIFGVPLMRADTGTRQVDILMHDYPSGVGGVAYGNTNDIDYEGFGIRRLIIAHEFLHSINNSYAWTNNFIAEGLATWHSYHISGFNNERHYSFTSPNVIYPATRDGWQFYYIGKPIFQDWPFNYGHAALFIAYIADRIEIKNIKDIIQVCKPGGVCDPDNPDNGDWYYGVDGLAYALSLHGLTLRDIVLDFHTTNLVNDSAVIFNEVPYGHKSIIYWPENFRRVQPGIHDLRDTGSFDHTIELKPGGVEYIRYVNASNLHLSINTNNPKTTSLRLLKERGTEKEFVDIAPGLREYKIPGEYGRVTLIAVHGNPRSDQADIKLEVSATQNYGVSTEGEELPARFALMQNYPNPFNPSTTVEYELPSPAYVRLEVFDVQGRKVDVLVDGMNPVGRHSIHFDAGGLASGLYLYRMQAGAKTFIRKMTLVR